MIYREFILVKVFRSLNIYQRKHVRETKNKRKPEMNFDYHNEKQDDAIQQQKMSSRRTPNEESRTYRNRLHSFRNFLNNFYVEQKENPFHALIGPGSGDRKTYALSHLWYIFIVCFIPVCSLLSTFGFVQPYLASDNTLCDWKRQPRLCESVIVVFITYRIGFSTTVFFLFTALVLSKTTNKQPDGFSTLHTGFWIEKVIVVLVLSCVAFAFPPIIFDVIWEYALLIGDVVFNCILLFLSLDATKDAHEKLQVIVDEKKLTFMNKTVLYGVEYTVVITAKLTFLLGAIYTTTETGQNIWVIMFLSIVIIVANALILFVTLYQKPYLLSTLCGVSLIYLLIWVTIRCYREYTKPTNDWQPIWEPLNMSSILLTFTLVVYSVIRKDKLQHFYFFYWIISRGDVIEDRDLYTDCILNQPKKKENSYNHYQNLNETLFDHSPTGMEPVQTSHGERQMYRRNTLFHDVAYNESFIHVYFALLSLKTTALVTNYNVLSAYLFDELKTTKSLPQVFGLYISITLMLVFITGYLYRCHLGNKQPLSVAHLLKDLLHNTWRLAVSFFIGIPNCLLESSLCRCVYSTFVFFIFVMACVIISPKFKKYFERLSIFCDHVTSFGACMSQDPAFVSLYRIFSSAGLFYWTLSILTLDVHPIRKIRKRFHKGCWPFKFVLLGIIFTVVTSIPNSSSRYFLYVSLASILTVRLLQLLCLLDVFGVRWNIYETSEESNRSKKTYISSVSLACFLYGISVMAFVCFYIFYAHNYRCAVARFFVSINLVLCLAASIISLHPIIKNGRLLFSAILTSFCMYNTWSALNYNPVEKCNPLAHTLMLVESKPSRDVVSVMDLILMFAAFVYFTLRINYISKNALDLILFSTLKSNILGKHKHGLNIASLTGSTLGERLLDESTNRADVEQERVRIEKWLTGCQNVTFEDVPKNSRLNNYDENSEELKTKKESNRCDTNKTVVSKDTGQDVLDQNILYMTSEKQNQQQTTTKSIELKHQEKCCLQSSDIIKCEINHIESDRNQTKETIPACGNQTGEIIGELGKRRETEENDDNNEYSYSSLHFICHVVCSYSFLLLAHWLEPVPGSGFKVSLHWAIMSVKLVASTLSIFVYIWYLVAPIIIEKIDTQMNS